MNKTLVKNILIALLVPSVISVGYFGTIYALRKSKEKKILGEINKKLSASKNKLEDSNEQVINNWKKQLSSLKTDDFSPFFNYFMATIPNGKVVSSEDNEKEIWVYEKTNPIEFAAISEKGINAMSGKEIEKLFNVLKGI